ncbi:MAG: cellulase family glycosylhydrolase, partial [Polyangiaceae bacterium]
YRALLDAADRAGISVIIDFHQDVFQAAFCGDGFPVWALRDIPHGPPRYDCGALQWSPPYFDPRSVVSRAFDGLWDNQDGLLDSFVAMWTKVAREFGKHPAVAAFEVINEPGSGSRTPDVFGATILPAVYDRVAAAIEAEVGPTAVLCDDPIVPINDVARLARPEHARFAYGPHFYDVLSTIGAPVDPARLSADVAAIIDRGETYGAPVVIGEYGVTNTHPMKVDFMSAVLDTADSRRASAMAWDGSISTMKWNDEDFSVFTSDGTERGWGAVLDRPVPRAIDGTILDWQWDAAAKTFSLSVEGQEDHVSEIYLPSRHLGASPKITVTGARHRFVSETGIVLVAPERGASWSLTAEPGN